MKKILFLPILFTTIFTSAQIYQFREGRLQQVSSDSILTSLVNTEWVKYRSANESLTAAAHGLPQPLSSLQASQTFATLNQLTQPYSANQSIYLYASSTGTVNSRPTFTWGSALNPSGSTMVNLSDNKSASVNPSYWADLLVKCQEKRTSSSSLYQTIGSVSTIDNTDAPVVFLSSSAFKEQHDVNSVSYFNTSSSQYATLASSENGRPSLTLYTSSNSFPGNQEGSISILQKSGEAYGIFVDSTGIKIGSSQNRGPLYLGAGTVFTTGDFESTGFIKTSSGLVAGDVDLSKFALPQNTLAYFGSSSHESLNVEINNQYRGSSSSAGIKMDLFGSRNSLTVFSNNPGMYGMNAGSFVMYAQTDNGIIINAVQNSPVIRPEIGFAINSRLIGAFVDGGYEPIGLTTEEILAIRNPHEGLELYNRTIHEKCIFNGRQWRVLPSYPLVKI